MNGIVWTKSTFSGNGNCVEIAFGLEGTVLVRDSKNRDGVPLVFTGAEWDAFTAGVAAGEMRRPA
jgi:hypothetical protein